MDADHSYSLIPDGELRCIWMDAGVVSYKLCDRGLECDGCPFDVEARRNREGVASGTKVMRSPKTLPGEQGSQNSATYTEIVAQQIKTLADVPVPADRLYHRNHFWLQHLDSDVYRIGIDHIAASLLRPVTSIVRANTPSAVRLLDPFCWLVVSRGTITIPSPIEGTIASFNMSIVEHPSLLDTDPYGLGWIAEFKARSKGRGMQDWVEAAHQPGLFAKQADAVLTAFTAAMRSNRSVVGPTLYDGGTGISDLESLLGPQHYFETVSRIFRLSIEN